jgi:hypothetical protein
MAVLASLERDAVRIERMQDTYRGRLFSSDVLTESAMAIEEFEQLKALEGFRDGSSLSGNAKKDAVSI